MSPLPSPDPRLLGTLAGVFGLLVVATLAAARYARWRPGASADEVRLRIRTWWGIVLAMGAVLLMGVTALTVFFALVSLLAWSEFLALWPVTRPPALRFICAAAVLLQYVWLLLPEPLLFLLFIPVGMLVVLALVQAFLAPSGMYLASLAHLQWGLLVTTFGLSHVPRLALRGATPGDGLCLVLYLVLLTGFNDVAQFLWGRSLSGPRLAPRLSPRKTWSGLLGGVATTLVLAWSLAPCLTPLSPAQAAGTGLLIGLGGALGDLAMSAVKRRAGVGASGHALPGHGGLLDRLDSLTFTAPLFMHTVTWWMGT
ncbi:MAG: phosphatidate cytidylyltransferase [Lentisphaerae bacterium]|nr:phosphatidate cytidylyltransferase [Lentisphaerota bacterium]